jgi:hypothetical protein
MLPQTLLLLAVQAQVVDQVSQAMLATVATVAFTAVEAAAVVQGWIMLATLAQAETVLLEL